jgi:hypothetical protein
MMKRFILVLIFGIIAAYVEVLPQNLEVLENRYNDLRFNHEKDISVLDSLKGILEKRAQQIEAEKQKQNPDANKINALRAGSVTLSNTINNYQEKLETDEKELRNLSKSLDRKYSVRIDSLKLLKKSKPENSEKLDGEILFYTEKQLSIFPQIELLSFNPRKILEIDLSKAKTNEEEFLLKEYLNSALTEVNSLLNETSRQSKEIENALILQKKTSKFLTDAELDRAVKVGNITRSSSNRTSVNAGLGDEIKLDYAEQINSYTLLINQLNTFNKLENITSQKFMYKSGKTNLNLKEYNELLGEVKQKLNDYKLVLTNKLNQAK